MESEVVVKRVELISQYNRTHDGRLLIEHLKEIVKEPFNLTEMYKPEDVADQAESIRVDNPYIQQQQQYTSYGQAPPGQNLQPPQGYHPPGGPGGYTPPQPSNGPQSGPPTSGRPNYNR